MKLPIVQNNNYIIYLEYFSDLYWLHTDVFNWTSKVKKDYLDKLNKLQLLLNDDLFGLVDNDKLGKFGSTIGFKYLRNVTGSDNNQYKVYTRRLEWVKQSGLC